LHVAPDAKARPLIGRTESNFLETRRERQLMAPGAAMTVSRQRLAVACLALLLPWTAMFWPTQPINHDVSWFFYVARGVMRGGILYRDFIEPNAPLASLSLVPAVWLSHVLATTPALAVEVTVLGAMGIVLLLCVEVLQCLRVSLPYLLCALLALTIAFLFMPKSSFGQREHILTMLLTPYMLGCVATCAGVRLPRALACLIGAAACIGVGLKPPFILVPAALELVTFAQAGLRRTWRAQPIALAIGLLVIIAVTLLFFPLYATTVVPWAAALYGGYDQPDAVLTIMAYSVVAFAFAWFGWNMERGKIARAGRTCAAVSVVAALGVYVLQGKGWAYQASPAWVFLFLLTAGAIASTPLWPAGSPKLMLRWGSARLLGLGFVIFILRMPSHADMAQYAGVAQAIAAEKRPFVILSTNVVPGFPLALQEDRVWASRTPCLIMLPGLVQAEQNGHISRWEAPFRQWIDADMRRYNPALVFVPPNGDQALPRGFDVLAWLLRDPAFASIWSHYHADGTRDGFRVFRLS
jgi:hypothetical protein